MQYSWFWRSKMWSKIWSETYSVSRQMWYVTILSFIWSSPQNYGDRVWLIICLQQVLLSGFHNYYNNHFRTRIWLLSSSNRKYPRFPLLSYFFVVVCLKWVVQSYSVIYIYIYICKWVCVLGALGLCFHYWCAVYGACHFHYWCAVYGAKRKMVTWECF